MIRCRSEFSLFDTIVNAAQKIFVNVRAVVDSAKILDEIVGLHSAISFDIGRMKIGI